MTRPGVLERGTIAPDFTLPATGHRTVSLADYRGRASVVLFFYPRDASLGCTIESCTFRDSYADFSAAGAVVIGISRDGLDSHERFATRYQLPYVLATDRDGAIARAYGVGASRLGADSRVTFVIDRHGVIRDAFSSIVRVKAHVSRALAAVRAIQAGAEEPR